MSRYIVIGIGAVCAIAVLCTCVSLAGAADGKPGLVARGTGVWLPSYDENGQLKSQIMGESMVMREEEIEVTGLKMEIMTNGLVDVSLSSEKCLYLPKKNEVTSSFAVRLERTNMVMAGTGFTWSDAKSEVKILNDIRVQVHDIDEWLAEPTDDMSEAEAVARDVETTITAERLVFLYDERTGFFDGKVLATDGEMHISANSMLVTFNQDNTARTLEAEGDVSIRQGAMTSTCDRAFCNIEDEQIVLHGNAQVTRENEIARGEHVILLMKQDRMICQPGYLKVGSFEDMDKIMDERTED